MLYQFERFTVDEATASNGDEVATFLRSLPPVDALLRFGGRPDWLIERLFREGERGATIARVDGAAVGLVDYVHTRCGLEFGIVVAAPHRRRWIASALLAATLRRAPAPGEPVFAYASRANVAAVQWLRKQGFVARPGSGEPLLFVRRRVSGQRAG